jgi:hypothetical protein
VALVRRSEWTLNKDGWRPMLAIHFESSVAVAAAGLETADTREVPMNERVIRADGIELATQAFGDPGQPPPLLLILGAMASSSWLRAPDQRP